MNIEILCPSRGRPAAAHALYESLLATKANASLVFLLDADDPTAKDYPEPQIISGPMGDPVQPTNVAALKSTADIIGWTGDDSRFETPYWDRAVIEALREPGVFWGSDGHDRPWPSTLFVSREIVQELGWLLLPTMKRGFFDRVWAELATYAGVQRENPNVMFRHDNSVHEGVAETVISEDQRQYELWKLNQMTRDIATVRRASDLAHFFPPDLMPV